MLASQTSLSWYWLWHPLFGPGYQLWSGIASIVSERVTIFALLGVYLYHHNCHTHKCWRLSWHVDEAGHPVCKRCHPDHPSRGWIRRDRAHPRHRARR